jgi:hypothetical protein
MNWNGKQEVLEKSKKNTKLKKRMETKEGKFKNLKSLKGWRNQTQKLHSKEFPQRSSHRRVKTLKKTRDQKISTNFKFN